MCAKKAAEDAEYTIVPENTKPAVNTSEWPLLLKNYDKRELLRLV